MGMLHVKGHGKIQISLRLHRSPLRFIPNRLLSRETLQRGSIGIFLPFISPPTPRKPILQLKGGKFLPFFLILSVVYDHFIFHSGSRNWLSRIGWISVSKNFPVKFRFMRWIRGYLEDRKLILFTPQIVFSFARLCYFLIQWEPDPDTDSGKWCPRIEFSFSSNWKISLYRLASIVVGEFVGGKIFALNFELKINFM